VVISAGIMAKDDAPRRERTLVKLHSEGMRVTIGSALASRQTVSQVVTNQTPSDRFIVELPERWK
jgi:hypothetical protein